MKCYTSKQEQQKKSFSLISWVASILLSRFAHSNLFLARFPRFDSARPSRGAHGNAAALLTSTWENRRWWTALTCAALFSQIIIRGDREHKARFAPFRSTKRLSWADGAAILSLIICYCFSGRDNKHIIMHWLAPLSLCLLRSHLLSDSITLPRLLSPRLSVSFLLEYLLSMLFSRKAIISVGVVWICCRATSMGIVGENNDNSLET